jgi:hypothetical protein
MDWDRIIEDKIREAQQEGKFENLPGHGRPLSLDEDLPEGAEWWAANHVLKVNGLRPDWLEEDLAVRATLAEARRRLVRTRDWRAAELAALGARDDDQALRHRRFVADEWSRAMNLFRESIGEVNVRTADLNLKVPHARFHRMKLNIEDELKRLLAQ